MRWLDNPRALGALALLAGLFLSLVAADLKHRANLSEAQELFQERARRVTDAVHQRLTNYDHGLRGLRGAYIADAHHELSRERLHAYTASRDLAREFPGARGMGLIMRVAPQDEAAFVAGARKDGWPDFTVRQMTPHGGERKLIYYVEPVERNAMAVGLDIASEINRNLAAETAVRTGEATLSAPVTLVQASGQKDRGMLLLLPIYRDGTLPATVAERQRLVVGWTYAPLIVDELLRGIGEGEDYTMRISDIGADGMTFFGAQVVPGPDLQDLPSVKISFPIHGREWQADVQATRHFVATLQQTSPARIGLGLGGLSLLLATIVYLLAQSAGRTRHERLEQARRAAIVEGSEDAIIGATLDGVITEWNGGAERLFGYPAAEALGRTMVSLLVPPERDHEDAALLRTIARGERVATFDTLRRHRDGSLLSVSLTAAPIFDAGGRCIGLAKTIRDTREAQRAREALAELNASLERQVADRTARLDQAMHDLRAILDAVPSMIGYWDRNLVNRVANLAYGQWFEAEPSAVVGRSMPELLGEDFQYVRERTAAALRGEKQVFERTVYRADGSRRHLLIHYLPDEVDGEVRGFYVMISNVTEITENRLQLAAAQRDNAALLTTLDQFALVSVADRDGRLVSVNDGLGRLSGYLPDRLVGRDQHALDSVGTDPSDLLAMRERIAGGQPWRGEIRCRARDGSTFWVDRIVAPFLDARGDIEKYVSISIDITPIKRLQNEAEQARRDAEDAGRFLREVTDRLPLRIAYLDRGRQFRFVNAALCEPIGQPRERVLGRRPDEFGELLAGEFAEAALAAALRGAPQRLEVELRQGGYTLDREVQFVPDRDEHGQVIGCFFVSADTGERKRADRELRRALAMLRGVLNAATQVSIVAFDAQGMVTVFNRGAQRLLGHAPDEVIGRTSARSFHDLEQLREDLGRSGAACGPAQDPFDTLVEPERLGHELECTLRRRDGVALPVSLVVTAMNDDAGELMGYLALAQDISARRQYEFSLKQAMHRANQANRAKSQFLANMSHEIRTPLNAVIGLSYLLERTTLDTDQSGFVAKIKLASKSLLSIINDVLDLSKIEASEMRIERAPFSLVALVRELSDLMALQADAKGIRFKVAVPPSLPAAVEGDATRLRQVLMNLLSNAIKFTEQGGVRLGIEVREAAVGSVRLRFVVNDSGIGIAPESLARLFRPFAQADTSTTRRYGGTGLGLSIVRQLMELMGGKVSASSTPGVGSEFVAELVLPLSDASQLAVEMAPPAQAGSGPSLPGVRVLVVDDSEINREVARRILQLEGAEVRLANDGQQAVDVLLAAPDAVDVVLMDVQMPVLDGHDATRRIRSALGLTRLPVIALTAGVTLGEQQRAADAGMNDVLGKPFDPRTLVQCIRRYVTVNPQTLAAAAPAPGEGERWPEIEGIDGADARRRLGGDVSLFHTLLKRLLRDFEDIGETHATDAAGMDWLAGRMHSLKGSAGTMGAKEIERLAAQTEVACRASDPVRVGHLVPLLASLLQALARAAEPFLLEQAQDPASAAMPLDGGADPREVIALIEQLRACDLAAMQRFAELAPDLRRQLGREAYGDLREKMDSLQFAEVADRLQQSMSRFAPMSEGSAAGVAR